MNRLNLITSKEYWIEALENAKYNKLSNESVAENIVDKINEALILPVVVKSVKEKEAMTFEEFVANNGYKQISKSNVYKNGTSYMNKESLLKIYRGVTTQL